MTEAIRIYDNDYLFHELTKFGVIAGGSIVYGICDFVPRSSVGDIDIFVNTLGDFHTCIDILRPYAIEYSSICKFLSVVEIKTATAIYQLIYKPHPEPYVMNLLESFDYDYVQCGYHKGKLYTTDRCKKSHEAREILEFNSTRFTVNRLKKAVIKGFKTPIIEKSRTEKVTSVNITYAKLRSAKIKPFNTYYSDRNNKIYYSMKSVELCSSSKLRIHCVRIDGNSGIYCNVDVFIPAENVNISDLGMCVPAEKVLIPTVDTKSITYNAQKELLLEVIKHKSALFTESTMVQKFLTDKDIAVRLLVSDSLKCHQIPSDTWLNREFVKDVLAYDSGHITYALKINKKYADDEELIRIVARSNELWIWYASTRIKQNRTLILDIIKTEDAYLDICDTIYYDDEELILAQSLPYVMDASERLRNDVDFMIKVIKKNPMNICYALCEVPIDVIMDAVKSTPHNIMKEISDTLRIQVLAQDGLMLKYINKSNHTPLIIGTAIMQNTRAIKYV